MVEHAGWQLGTHTPPSMPRLVADHYAAKIRNANPGWRVEIYDEDGGMASIYVVMAYGKRHAGWWIFTADQAEECLT